MVPTFRRDSAGQIWLNDERRFAKGVVLTPRTGQVPLVVAATAEGNTVLEGPQHAVTEVYSLMGQHDAGDEQDVQNRFRVVIGDDAYRRRLMNRAILCSQVFGNGLRPFRLLETLVLEPQQTLSFRFENPSAAGPANFRLAAEGRRFDQHGEVGLKLAQRFWAAEGPRKSYLAPYWLTTENPVHLGALGSQAEALLVNGRDNSLALGYILCNVITDAEQLGGDTQEIFEFRLFDGTSNRELMNQPVTLNTGTGTAQFPFRLDPPLLVEPLTNLRVRFTALASNARDIEIFFTLAGVQCYTGLAPFAQQGA